MKIHIDNEVYKVFKKIFTFFTTQIRQKINPIFRKV